MSSPAADIISTPIDVIRLLLMRFSFQERKRHMRVPRDHCSEARLAVNTDLTNVRLDAEHVLSVVFAVSRMF